MSEYSQTVEVMDCDFNRNLPPSQILGHCLSITQIDIVRDGCRRDVLLSRASAVWMISAMRIYQYDNLRPGDRVVYKTFPRVIEGNKYIYYVEIYREGKLVVRFDTCYIPVHFERRKIIPLEEIEPLWSTPPRRAVTKYLTCIRPDCEFTDWGSDTVRLSDCDCNGHMTSTAYAGFACNVLDFWNGDGERLMKMIQVDYRSEVMPGTELSFRRGESGGIKYMQGLKPDGTVAFTAACIFD